MRATADFILRCRDDLNGHLRRTGAQWRAEVPFDTRGGWSFAVRPLDCAGYRVVIGGLRNREIALYLDGVFTGLRLPRGEDEDA